MYPGAKNMHHSLSFRFRSAGSSLEAVQAFRVKSTGNALRRVVWDARPRKLCPEMDHKLTMGTGRFDSSGVTMTAQGRLVTFTMNVE